MYKELFEIYPKKNDLIEIVQADLLVEADWDRVVKGCDFVLHIACPVFMKKPNTKQEEDKFIRAAVEGTRFIMEACVKYKIKKVVYTSSRLAVVN